MTTQPMSAEVFSAELMGHIDSNPNNWKWAIVEIMKQHEIELTVPLVERIAELESGSNRWCSMTIMMQERIDLLEDNLRWILPMAKGYAHAHPVGSNQEKVNGAIEALQTIAEEKA